MVAFTGQSFVDAVHSSAALLKRNLVPAAAVTVSSLCVVGVITFFVLLAASIVGVTFHPLSAPVPVGCA